MFSKLEDFTPDADDGGNFNYNQKLWQKKKVHAKKGEVLEYLRSTWVTPPKFNSKRPLKSYNRSQKERIAFQAFFRGEVELQRCK